MNVTIVFFDIKLLNCSRYNRKVFPRVTLNIYEYDTLPQYNNGINILYNL